MIDPRSLAWRLALEWLSITSKILVLSMSLIVALVFWTRLDPSVHDRSLVGLINKFSVFAGLIQADANLLMATSKYQDRYQDKAINQPYPRVLLQPLSNWPGQQPAQLLTQRIARLEYNKERLIVDCDRDHLLQNLLCYFQAPSELQRQSIEQQLSNFNLIEPKDSGQYGNSWELAIGYDLARTIPGLSPDTSEKVQQKIVAALTKHLQLLDANSASLWHGRSTIAASALILAAVLDLDKPEHKQLFSRSYGHFSDVIDALEATETWPEGFNYWLQERGMPIALGLAAFKNVSRDQTEKNQLDYLMRRIGLWHIYLTRPDYRIEGWGDEGSRSDLKDGARRIIDILAQASGDSLLGRYSHFLKNLHPQESYNYGRLWQMVLFNDPFVADRPIEEIQTLEDVMGSGPAAALFVAGYSNHLIIRSGWKPEDTFISFRASDIFTHHQHYDAGHFTLFKQAPLAVNSSTYGDFFGPHRLNYAIRTIAKNSLLVIDSQEQVTPNQFFKTNVIDGGQRIVLPTGSAVTSFDHWQDNRTQGTNLGASELLAYESMPGAATYIKTDITRAYNSIRFDTNGGAGKVKRVTRELLYLYAEDSLMVRDEVITTDPAHQVRWLLHTYNKFAAEQHRVVKGTLEDGILKSANSEQGLITQHQRGRLKIDIIEPVVDEITQVGGPSYRYFVAAPESPVAGSNFTAGSSPDPWFEQPLWRSEIDSPSTDNRHRFLVVLQPRSLSEPFAPVNRADSHTANSQGVRIGRSLILFRGQACRDNAPNFERVDQVVYIDMPDCYQQLKLEHANGAELQGARALFIQTLK